MSEVFVNEEGYVLGQGWGPVGRIVGNFVRWGGMVEIVDQGRE